MTHPKIAIQHGPEWLRDPQMTLTDNLELRHFKPAEFFRAPDAKRPTPIYWGKAIARDLLLKVDEFRERWGTRVDISPAPGAIGRLDPPTATSRHNLIRWDWVMALDLMPWGMTTRADAERAVAIAEELKINGIGLYPDWKPRPGLHLDVRETPGRWGGVRDKKGVQQLVALSVALEAFPDG